MSWQSSNGLAQEVTDIPEPPLTQFSVKNLVLSQTGSNDKANLERLCDGDRVVEWNGTPVSNNKELVRAWLACAGYETVPVKVERQTGSGETAEKKQLEIEYRLLYASKIFETCAVGGRTDFAEPAKVFPHLMKDPTTALEDAVVEVIGVEQKKEILAPLDQAFKRLTDTVKGHYRTDAITFLLNHPLRAHNWAEDISNEYAATDALSGLVQQSAKTIWTSSDPMPPRSKVQTSAESWPELIEILNKEVEEINQLYQMATKKLTPDELKVWNQWCRDVRPIWKGQGGWDEFSAGFHLTKKLDQEALVECYLQTARLADQLRAGGEFFELINKLKSTPPEQIRHNHVTIGKADDSNYDQFTAITIELGGNDDYQFPESGLDPEFPIRFIVDLAGDDEYTASKNGIAAGVGGVSVLIDINGNDKYMTDRNGIGFAVCGIGILDDGAGIDLYSGREFVQGTACVGVGLLVDRDGNDIYDAGHYSQAVGLPGGCGAIVDMGGDDQYRCTGKVASLYGDAGEFNGMGQGCGFGYRYLGFGGVGILQDRAGRDFYRAGQFGLGCGYFFGTGLVNDRDGDDVFECSRYGLGTSAHYAAGLVLDNNGNDIYLAMRRSAVAEMGSSWDLSLGMLVDEAGHDVYRCHSYALGGSAQTSYGFFWDRGGNDQYLTSPNAGAAGGYVGGANYGAGRGADNLSLFLDDGGTDFYADDKKDGAKGVNGEFGIWIDR